uniref:C-myc promoter-binding protein n=1 Tax=Timema poppense TaxID=170557 RepID=A0A7R9CLE1_TIMPO|nr:unnamed protein product [Timema poppensis]
MDERRVADYFVVAGLPDQPELQEDFSCDGVHLKPTHNQAPITDVTVVFPGLGEEPPPEFTIIESTPTGYCADLNHGSLRSPDIYLCYRRGRDKPPLVDIGIMYEGKERIMSDSEVVLTTPGGRVANVNNSTAKIFVTYRRASLSMPCNELVVTDICVILTNKGETAPHAFCMINKNLNKGMVGSDVFLCYKKSMNRANLIPYKPGILMRYPHYDHANFAFPASLPLFCLPMGATVECWPSRATQPRPVFSTFVLTVSDASEKLYGSAVTFYERMSTDNLTTEQCKQLELSPNDDDNTVNVNKCICLLSHWPFFDTFEKFLLFLYNMSCTGPHTVPIERHISHFLENVPFPSPQRPQILVQLSASDRVVLTQPEDLPLPRSGASFRELLMNLGPDNCLMVLLLALTEQKLLVHSLRPDVLTAVAEAISMIIFPFKWQCPYIPLCPLGLAEVLHAPLPFLIGVDSRFFDLYDPPTDVNCVDLDTNNITVCEEKRNLNTKLLPKKPARALKNTLDVLSQKLRLFVQSLSQDPGGKDGSIDRDFQLKRKEQALELEIQEAFLRFMATILKGYRVYLLPITKAPTIGTTDPNSLFDLQGFQRSRDKAHHKLFALVMKTQMFIRFIEERSFVSDMDAGLAFFDECTEKVDSDELDCRLIELDESHKSERTVFIPPPEPIGLPAGVTYAYKHFTMNPLLFSRKELKNFLRADSARLSGVLQGSPLARRTKHEIKSAQKLARKYAALPDLWAKCLLGTCYSLWFIHLPSYAIMSQSKAPTCLRTAYDILVKIHKMKLQTTDEVCYRVMMQLCGVYSQPVLAVKLLFHMKRCGIQPNAITYGFYNRAVLDSTWPSDCTNSGQLLWNKLRNVIMGVALFRQAASRKRVSDELSSYTEGADVVSRTSIDSGNSHEQQDQADSRSIKTNSDSSSFTMTVINEDMFDIEMDNPETFLEYDIKKEDISDTDKIDKHDGDDAKPPAGSRTNLTEEMDFTAFDRYRNRHGSIVRPTGVPFLPSRPTVHQQSFESSAGLLMTCQNNSPVLLEEETDLFDGEGTAESPAPGGRRQRNRSGSCSEFVFGIRGGPHCPTSPKASRSPDSSSPVSENWKQLMRSESFANDARILDNLNRLKLGLQKEGKLTNGRVAPILERGDGYARVPHVQRGSSSRSLFGRKGSFNIRQSQDSSTENLEERSSAGSTDDLDSTGSQTPRRLMGGKLFSAINRFGTGVLERTRIGGSQEMKIHTSKHNSSVDSLLSDVNSYSNCDSESNKLASVLRTTGEQDSVILSNDLENRDDNTSPNSPTRVSSPSQKTSPVRTPVTQNDPLGALDLDEIAEVIETGSEQQDSELSSLNSTLMPGTVVTLDMPEAAERPLLFGRGVSRSATFGVETESGGEEVIQPPRSGGKAMQRSSTMPVDVPVSSSGATTALGSIGSTFKLPFRRRWGVGTLSTTAPITSTWPCLRINHYMGLVLWKQLRVPERPQILFTLSGGHSRRLVCLHAPNRFSPARFSLRARELRAGTQIIENAIANFSPSSLTSKKSNELLQGGLNSLKSAATSVVKKFDEIKEAMSVTSTPVKAGTGLGRVGDRDSLYSEGDTADTTTESVRRISNEFSPLAVHMHLDYWGNNFFDLFGEGSRKGSASNLQPLGSLASSQLQLFPENLYSRDALTRDPKAPVALEILMTTCSKCHNCGSALYDEEIMAGWSPEDSNLNTKVYFVPIVTYAVDTLPLTVKRDFERGEVCEETISCHEEKQDKELMLDYRGQVMMVPAVSQESVFTNKGNKSSLSQLSNLAVSSTSVDSSSLLDPDLSGGGGCKSAESEGDLISKDGNKCEESNTEPPVTLEPITVPYLNPLVLRKEFENILHNEGDTCLTQPRFVDEHPIIYWNMMWVFQRINVVSHLPGLSLQAATVNKGQTVHASWANCDHRNVAVRSLWDNSRLHEEVGQPMYVLWQQKEQHSNLINALVTDRTTLPRSVLQMVISSVRGNDLLEPLKKLATERQKLKGRGVNRTHSLYRDILFLAFTVMGRDNIDQAAFDREYVSAYERLSESDLKLHYRCDQPISLASLCCRHYFKELDL